MSYPEKGAGYRHQPKFLDRAIAEEGRASGGAVPTDPDSEPFEERSGPAFSEGSRGALTEAMKYHQAAKVQNDQEENYGQGPTRRNADAIFAKPRADTGDRMDADTSSNQPDFMRGLKPKRDGGAVKRADGGGIEDGDYDDDAGVDMTAGTEVDDELDDELQEKQPRRRRGTQKEED